MAPEEFSLQPVCFFEGNFNIIFLFTHPPYMFKIDYIILLSTHHHISSGKFLILSCYVNRCLTRGLFASVLTTTTVYAHLIPFVQATWPTYLILLDFKILITHGEQYSSLICSFLFPPVNASLVGPYIVFSTFSQGTNFFTLTLIWKTQPPLQTL